MHDPLECPVLNRREFHDELQVRLRAHRERVARACALDLDGLLGRHGFLTDDAELFFNPLAQPIVTFPLWVAAAVGFDGVERAAVVLDVVESTVMGYLYVRVHDDLMDEGVGEPTTPTSGHSCRTAIPSSPATRRLPT